jgi:hypothetical protein
MLRTFLHNPHTRNWKFEKFPPPPLEFTADGIVRTCENLFPTIQGSSKSFSPPTNLLTSKARSDKERERERESFSVSLFAFLNYCVLTLQPALVTLATHLVLKDHVWRNSF